MLIISGACRGRGDKSNKPTATLARPTLIRTWPATPRPASPALVRLTSVFRATTLNSKVPPSAKNAPRQEEEVTKKKSPELFSPTENFILLLRIFNYNESSELIKIADSYICINVTFKRFDWCAKSLAIMREIPTLLINISFHCQRLYCRLFYFSFFSFFL